jgi:RNA polymerase sigma factor (sigma-70 family)
VSETEAVRTETGCEVLPMRRCGPTDYAYSMGIDLPSRSWNQSTRVGQVVGAMTFDAVFEAEFCPLHRYLNRRVGSTAADDLAAETFAEAYRTWDRLDPARPIRPWLYGIAANLMRRYWRSERRMLRAYARTGVDPVLDDLDALVARADAQALRGDLADALAALRPRDREILLLHAWAELSDSEIAAALSLPVGTVKSRLHRTRARLRNRLAPVGQVAVKALITPGREPR